MGILWLVHVGVLLGITSALVWEPTNKEFERFQSSPPSYVDGVEYVVTDVSKQWENLNISLVLHVAPHDEIYGADIEELLVTVTMDVNVARVKITDKKNKRWEVPADLFPCGRRTTSHEASLLEFTYTNDPFTFQVTRQSDGYVLFDSSTLSLVYKNQYLQISTRVDEDLSIYGLGESTRNSMKVAVGEKHTLWTRDEASFNKDINTYGAHPFFLGLNRRGNAHGVFLLNSNGMDVTLEHDKLVYQVIGGVLDFYILNGPTPRDVMTQYTALIGRPRLQPYWAYGFHQCRWGYTGVADLEAVVANYTDAKIPLDVMWADIDYMNKYHDFTVDPIRFNPIEMAKFIENLHKTERKFVPIIDPGIPDDSNDLAFQRGMALDIFIKDTNGDPYLGQVWPGSTVFPDFLHPYVSLYWHEQLVRLHHYLEFDGIWIDMNELANFCPGTSCKHDSRRKSSYGLHSCSLQCIDNQNTWDHPPFSINNGNSHEPIFFKTISTSAQHYGKVRQYDAHNLYGLLETIVTSQVQESILSKRSFTLSRSTFPSSGAHGAHWTGDNAATWNDLQWSIMQIQNFGLFGIPMVGADICGFAEDTTMELCARWIAVGSFYPFARNHNMINQRSQELYRWPQVAHISRKFLGMRYQLLSYLYTLGYRASQVGMPLARPLFMEFPTDRNTHDGIAVQRQFMLGSSLLIIPVVYQGVSAIRGYIPKGTWYDVFEYTCMESMGELKTWNVTLEDMPVLIRGGSIVPMHPSGALTSAQVRQAPIDLVVALGEPVISKHASGELYLDDGESLASDSTLIEFEVHTNGHPDRMVLHSKASINKYSNAQDVKIRKIIVLGVRVRPTIVIANGINQLKEATYNTDKLLLEIDLSKNNLSIVDDLLVMWSYSI